LAEARIRHQAIFLRLDLLLWATQFSTLYIKKLDCAGSNRGVNPF
jgi:hypothetical protein